MVHELGLCRSIASTVLQHAAGRQVERVVLRVGRLRQVVPESIESGWAFVSTDPSLVGSRIEVLDVPVVVRCRGCRATSDLEGSTLRCRRCGSADVEVISGDEFLVESIVVRDG